MFWGLLTILNFCLSVASGSPHANIVEDLWRKSSYRISDNVFEDAVLDVPDLIRKYKYPIEVHEVITEDGYILQMHRIPYGRDRNNTPGSRPVVFLMHGFLSSSADWIVTGPGTAFAYMLAEEGFDVWLGNARGNYYSRRHVTLNPDAILNNKFWKFTWDEIGELDLTAAIDYILDATGLEKLHYVGHSQGTTTFFVMASLRPEYNDKTISMQALAPVAYMAHNTNPLFIMLSWYANDIEFFPHSDLMTWAGETFCKDEEITQPLCSNIIFLIGGWNEDQLNTTILPIIFGHAPAGGSSRQLIHYAQGISGKEFRRYDYGTALSNLRRYGRTRPPRYDLSLVTTPVFLHYSDNDPLAHVQDVDRLFRELGGPIGKFRVPMASFSHLDYIWGIDAKDLVYTRTINLIKTMESAEKI